jgi:hypothetical protein
MSFEEAKNLIESVLNNQRMTIQEHTKIQMAWKAILGLAEQSQAAKDGAKHGDDAVHVPEPIRQGQ